MVVWLFDYQLSDWNLSHIGTLWEGGRNPSLFSPCFDILFFPISNHSTNSFFFKFYRSLQCANGSYKVSWSNWAIWRNTKPCDMTDWRLSTWTKPPQNRPWLKRHPLWNLVRKAKKRFVRGSDWARFDGINNSGNKNENLILREICLFSFLSKWKNCDIGRHLLEWVLILTWPHLIERMEL